VSGNRVQIDEETWHVLEVVRRENNRPITLKAALQQSAGKPAREATPQEISLTPVCGDRSNDARRFVSGPQSAGM
jgi:hypothetical protein